MVRIEAPHFCAGIVQQGGCAPILAYMKGWTLGEIRTYCDKQGWTMSVIRIDMRLLVFGGRNYADVAHVAREIECMIAGHDPRDITIIEGGATGADAHAKAWARANAHRGVKHLPFPADWENLNAPGAVVARGRHGLYNVRAGFDRNQRMLDEGKPTHALGFPGGTGTADMIRRIHEANRCGAGINLSIAEAP